MTREENIAQLIKEGMDPMLAPRAFDSFMFLLDNSEAMLDAFEKNIDAGVWARYGFMQGFVAGAMAQAHHN